MRTITQPLQRIYFWLISALAIASMPMTHAETDTFNVTISGQGRPMILIPGLMSDARVWHRVKPKLEKHYQVHSISLAGFGQSPSQANLNLEQVKHQLGHYVNRLAQPIIVGHSLGGVLALWLASEQPQTVGPVISIDGLPFIGVLFTGSNSTHVNDMAITAQQLKQSYTGLTPVQLEALVRQSIARQATDIEDQQRIIKMSGQSDPKFVANALYTMLTTDLRKGLGRIDKGLLLLGASGGFSSDDASKKASQSLYREQLSESANAQLKMHRHSRHFIMLDQPQWLLDSIKQFLEG